MKITMIPKKKSQNHAIITSTRGGEPPMNDLDRRVTVVETHIEHIRSDISDIKSYIKMGLGILIVSILIPIALHFIS